MTNNNPLVLGLDVATTTGFAYGRVDAVAPMWGFERFGKSASTSPEVFGAALTWATGFIAELRPDIIMLEALLPPQAMKGETTRMTRDRLCGLNAIVMACAHNAGVGEIASASVQDIRNHFISQRTLPRHIAKSEVMDKCTSLGWMVTNDNAADAVAAWSYACALIDPKLALRGSPLFNKIVSMW